MLHSNSSFVAVLERLCFVRGLDLSVVLQDCGVSRVFFSAVRDNKRDCRDLPLSFYLALSRALSTDVLSILLPSFTVEFRSNAD